MKKKYVISVDMGGTKILAAILNSEKGIIKRLKVPTVWNNDPEQYVQSLSKIVNEIIQASGIKGDKIAAVCLGIPGSVNPYSGVIAMAPNLGIRDYNIKEKLSELIPYPVLIENDVNLGALGVKYYGLGKNAADMLVVFIGTGIGAGFIFDGKLFRGANFTAGEIGHIKVKKNGPLCGCGNYGCLEAVASRTAIDRDIKKALNKGERSILKEFASSDRQIKSKALANAVKEKDKLAIKHLTKACRTIGKVLADITNLLNLDLIILGGGVIEALDKFMIPVIREEFDKNALPSSSRELKMLPTKLGDDAALYGGIVLAEEFLNIKV
ncbi:MAG TPA: ROK family protein [Ignavibacteriaceae bacterium]|nr:ROK family protein [Ignavibacteriaceae bacterium]